jgi:transcriptional regulator with XRE-family HTH domain
MDMEKQHPRGLDLSTPRSASIPGPLPEAAAYESYDGRVRWLSELFGTIRAAVVTGVRGILEGFATALGEAIRQARRNANLSQRELQSRTGGRFKPSAVGGYERGERDISVGRLVDLAHAMGVPPEDLLAEALCRASPRTHREVAIDLVALEREPGRAADAVGEWVRRTQLQRREFFHDVITLRASDLEIVADSSGLEPRALLKAIEHAVIRIGPDE